MCCTGSANCEKGHRAHWATLEKRASVARGPPLTWRVPVRRFLPYVLYS